MAIGDYRYRVPGGQEPEVTANGKVNFDVFVERQTDAGPPEVWTVVRGGHFTLSVDGTILEAAQNAGEALNAIEQLILNRGLIQSDRAHQALLALLPGGTWPVNDVTRDITIP